MAKSRKRTKPPKEFKKGLTKPSKEFKEDLTKPSKESKEGLTKPSKESKEGLTKPSKESYIYICQSCMEPVKIEPGGQAYRHADGTHTHLDNDCIEGYST